VEVENKELEFDQASFGTIGLETLAIAFLTEASKQGLTKADQHISHHPAAFLGFKQPELQVGERVKGMVISKEVFVFEANSIISKSKNSIFIDHKFDYKITGVYGQ
jgi:dihydroorotase